MEICFMYMLQIFHHNNLHLEFNKNDLDVLSKEPKEDSFIYSFNRLKNFNNNLFFQVGFMMVDHIHHELSCIISKTQNYHQNLWEKNINNEIIMVSQNNRSTQYGDVFVVKNMISGESVVLRYIEKYGFIKVDSDLITHYFDSISKKIKNRKKKFISYNENQLAY